MERFFRNIKRFLLHADKDTLNAWTKNHFIAKELHPKIQQTIDSYLSNETDVIQYQNKIRLQLSKTLTSTP